MKPDLEGTAATHCLATFNRRWDHLLTLAGDHLPAWEPQLRLTAPMRAQYNTHLPIHTYLDELQAILGLVLPDPAWVPVPIRQRAIPSIPDLWASLPAPYQQRLTWEPHELFALACALASPAHFGTQPDRYPEQAQLIASVVRLPDHPPILDLGCGTGQDTWQLANHLPTLQLTGITLEPLEAWMATKRRLPHLLDAIYPGVVPTTCAPVFFAADIRTFALRRPVQLIICNGLLGGPALHEPGDLQQVIARLHRVLVPGGYLLHANHFHDGHQKSLTDLHQHLTTRFTPVRQEATSHLWLAHAMD